MEQHIESNNEKIYEITALLRDEDFSPVRQLLETYAARIMEERPLEKTHLSYPILKERFVFQGVCYFTMPEASVARLQNDLRFASGVLRSMVRSVKRVGAKSGANRGLGLHREAGRLSGSREGRRSEGQVLTNEALEKKIEEILQ